MSVEAGFPPKVVFICEECKKTLFWNGSDADLSKLAKDMIESEFLPCPMCNHMHEIDPLTKRMLEDVK